MTQYIDKNAVLAEIKRIEHETNYETFTDEVLGKRYVCKSLLSFINTLEVKEDDTWHLQEKEDIYDAVKDWSLYTFACIMKDGTIQKFTGCRDEDYEGHINVHIDGVNDDYDNVNDIIKWTELPNSKLVKE